LWMRRKMGTESTVLVLGASGMLGHAVLRCFCDRPGYSVVGSVRSDNALRLLPQHLRDRIVTGLDVENADALLQLFTRVKPKVVVNCIGLVKQLPESDDPLASIPINSLLPHRLLRLCKLSAARLIHVSTDCVFTGSKGMYRETDQADARDLYGRSKFLGEVDDAQAVTLRTSIIGPELASAHGLLAWFLTQKGHAKGYTRAIFSGLPTAELARVMRDVVAPREELRGLYHISATPISKYDLLCLIARVYDLAIDIEPASEPVLDRSLDSSRFHQATGYTAPPWPVLIRAMRDFG
jgi:dTDP-4-dehydrorhamnose reductase